MANISTRFLVTGIFLVSSAAQADPAGYSDNAQVLSVVPLMEQVYETVGRRKCVPPAPAPIQPPTSTLGADIRRQEQLARRPSICHWVEELEPKERITAYRVTYSYDGRRYTRTMQQPPGKILPVRVTLKPVR